MILLGDIALFWLYFASLGFVILYHKSAPWWKSEMGVHLMTFALTFTVVSGYLVTAVFTRNADPSQVAARIYIYTAFAALMTWRLFILAKSQCPWFARFVSRKRDQKE